MSAILGAAVDTQVALAPSPPHGLGLYQSWSHAVATRSRWRRGQGFKGKGGVRGARKCDGQVLTALCQE